MLSLADYFHLQKILKFQENAKVDLEDTWMQADRTCVLCVYVRDD